MLIFIYRKICPGVYTFLNKRYFGQVIVNFEITLDPSKQDILTVFKMISK